MMNTLRTVAMSVGLPVALLAGAAQSASATIANDASGDPQAAPTTTVAPAPALAAFPPPTGAIPADWPILVDDTQTIAIAAPGAWSQTDTIPALTRV